MKIDELLKQDDVNSFLKEINNQLLSQNTEFNFNFSQYDKFQLTTSISKPIDKNLSASYSSNLSRQSTTSNNSADKTIEHSISGATVEAEEGRSKKFAAMIKKKELIAKYMGTTANIVLIDQNFIYVANAGDSIAVMYKDKKAIKLNTEHKTAIVSEQERIYNAGLKVINNRVEGKLNLTRALGDLCFKSNNKLKQYEQAVTCYPEVNKYKITDDIEFIIMGCDGIWDCVDVQKFCNHISLELRLGIKQPKVIISELMDQILSRSKDCKYLHNYII